MTPTTVERLFVYGTLAPERSNHHVLADIRGSWQPATVTGKLYQRGWGASQGYPGIIVTSEGEAVEGFLLTSDQLRNHWSRLDAFEGEGYQRVVAIAALTDGRTVEAFVYALSDHPVEPSLSE